MQDASVAHSVQKAILQRCALNGSSIQMAAGPCRSCRLCLQAFAYELQLVRGGTCYDKSAAGRWLADLGALGFVATMLPLTGPA